MQEAGFVAIPARPRAASVIKSQVNYPATLAPLTASVIEASPPRNLHVPTSLGLAALSFVAVVLTASGLVWKMYWKTTMIISLLVIVLAVVNLASGKHHPDLVRPLVIVSAGNAILCGLGICFTLLDLDDKCDHHRDPRQKISSSVSIQL
eukprot:c6550_g1_i1.p1 GENE.c6550_g1_i1~~c6550_g1_i1.p1  ORF type:complete len:162 (-),score=13.80 c6550_g1_i1:207-656(-)